MRDLYPAPTSQAVKDDLAKAAAEARDIKERYQGKLVALAGDGAALAQAIAAYEGLSDTIGKLGSYAGLLYAADTSDPDKAKFYGDIQEKITAITTDLIFFELELNKIDDAALARALAGSRRSPATSRGSTICARRSPTSSTSSSSACSTRSRSPRAAPGAGCSARP